jgi:nucleoside transporter
MNSQLRWRLSVMMLGAPVAKGGLGFSDAQMGVIFSLLPLASIVMPFITGQLADRAIATQKMLGVLQILSAVSLVIMASQHTMAGMSLWMLIYSLIFAPTLALTNSLAFHHLAQSDKEFGAIRVWGTVGWIVSGLILTGIRYAVPHLTPAGECDCLLLAAVMATILGFFSFSLPDTPPQKEAPNPLAFLDALKLLKDRNFAAFMIISFVVATELQFYYLLTAPFLTKRLGVQPTWIPITMATAQAAELIVMGLVLPKLLPKIGVRRAMVIGILAWPIRYLIFAAGAALPILKPLVIASLTLHGFCYVFFFVVGFIYVDQVAHKDIRASAQSLIALVVLGAGAYVGSLFSGWIGTTFTDKAGVENWTGVFLVPCALTVVCAIIFPLLFRESTTLSKDAVDEQPLTTV